MQLKKPIGTKYIRFVLYYEKPIAVYLCEERDVIQYNLIKDQLFTFDLMGFRRWLAVHGIHHQLLEDVSEEDIRELVRRYGR